jgi:predicted nucleotidyltransferase
VISPILTYFKDLTITERFREMKTLLEDRKINSLPSLDQIMQNLRAHLPQLREEYNIRYVWLFGSFVRGKQHKRSDLDVLVEFEEAPTLPKFISLEDRMGKITGLKVDLVSIKALRGEIGERILQDKVAL